MSRVVEDFKNSSGQWVKTYLTEQGKFTTLSGMVWQDMLSRCKVGSRFHEKHPTYIGCNVSAEFNNFQSFTEWHTKQTGYSIENYQLDKDIICNGNKIYSRDYCVLVPRQLNTFMISCDSARGVWPQGVHYEKSSNKFKAQISISGVKKSIGRYATPELAYKSYKFAKEAEACRWYSRLLNGEFIVDLRVVERMRTWTLDY
jgi:hypothetical protein